jgi:hypothetical protein
MLLAGAAAVIATTSGDGSAASADAPTAISTPPTADPTPSDRLTDGASGVRSVDASPAGVVGFVFDGDLSVATVDVAPGWTSEIEQARGREIEVVFTDGAARIDVEVEVEDGAPRERVRTRTDDDGGGEVRDDRVRDLDDDDGSADDDDDDRSGRRDGDDDDDRSGHDDDDDHPDDD